MRKGGSDKPLTRVRRELYQAYGSGDWEGSSIDELLDEGYIEPDDLYAGSDDEYAFDDEKQGIEDASSDLLPDWKIEDREDKEI